MKPFRIRIPVQSRPLDGRGPLEADFRDDAILVDVTATDESEAVAAVGRELTTLVRLRLERERIIEGLGAQLIGKSGEGKVTVSRRAIASRKRSPPKHRS